MKKVISILVICFFYVSCLAVKAPAVYTGMSISDFLKTAKHEELVSMSGGITIYRVQYGYNGQEYRFYYFRDGKLYEMNEGVRKVDRRIQIDSN